MTNPPTGAAIPARPNAVLTGATGGIGQEIVKRLLDAGYHVHALTRRPETITTTFPNTPHLTATPCDLTDPASIEAAASSLATTAPVKLLIHCAGSIHPEAAEAIQPNSLAEQTAINLTAPILLTSRLLPLMTRGSHIIFLNSMAGILPLPGNSIYTATKFGLRGFARSLQLDVAPKGIRVSSLYPGAVDTPMLQKEMEDGGSPLNFVSTPLTPGSIADLVLHTTSRKGRELFRPKIDGLFSHLCLMLPPLFHITHPILKIIGRKGQTRYQQSRKNQ